MECLGVAQSVAQSLHGALQCSELKEFCSVWGYESELENLERTVNTIKAVLLAAESKHVQVALSHQAQLWVDELKDVVYDADDLLDEFVTLAELTNRKVKDVGGDNLFNKMRRCFSFDNPILVAFSMSRRLKEIRNKLDSIAHNHNQFGFKLDCQSILRRREDTCSYVNTKDVIGRDDDLEKIVNRLLNADVQKDVSCLTIVGIGGLGKTTLAQLVHNDPRIKENFPLTLWACVSDQDPKSLDMKSILCKILHSATCENHEHLGMEPLQKRLQELLTGKKYFLVLDDVWNENRLQWLELANFLMSGLKGSWIMVTTRSEKTAAVVGGEYTYILKGLSDEDSWRLLEKTALGQRDEQVYPFDLLEIGRTIVKRCANVPLAIRVVGSLLYDQGKEKWLSFQEISLGRITQGDYGGIKPILKLSYLHLEPPLKICFGYCALFPKDYVIKKEKLISLWMAQGYIVPFDEGQSVEDAGEEYFSILVRRFFFQDVLRGEHGEIVSCKIHDLMDDIAQEVAGKEVYVANSIPSNLDNKIRHLSHLGTSEGAQSSFSGTKVRTYLQFGKRGQSHQIVGTLLANWTSLRALDLSSSRIKNLLALGKLLHLRYLDLSGNSDLEVLPSSITKLHNLQTLRIAWCSKLRELPEDLRELTKLRVLDTTECKSLVHMPRGIGKLISLKKLPSFIVGEGTSGMEGVQLADQLEEIKALKNLKGNLLIHILTGVQYDMKNCRKGGYLSQHLNEISVTFSMDIKPFRTRAYDEELFLLEDLQPYPNLRGLKLEWYSGGIMPSWAREDNLASFLPNLVCIHFKSCGKLQHIAGLGKLPKLKFLTLDTLFDLEYIEDTTYSSSSNATGASPSKSLILPSLEQLKLKFLPKLKGWWRDHEKVDSKTNQDQRGLLLPSFPCVSYLEIMSCPNLASMPLCPSLEELMMVDCNVNLRVMKPIRYGKSKLRSVHTSNAGHLRAVLPIEAFQCLKQMVIYIDRKLESLSEVEEVFRSSSSSLQSLKIESCDKLKSLCGGLEHLTVLEKLHIGDMSNLKLSNGVEDDGELWRCLGQNLRSLQLSYLPNLVNLPKGMCHLTALQSLTIVNCRGLKSLPESIRELSSLKRLEIRHCSASLKERC